MSKLVRARVKPVEQLPEWSKCCDEIQRRRELIGDMVVDLDRMWVMGEERNYCRYCKAVVVPPETKEVLIVSGSRPGWTITLDLIDLDEGPTEAA